MAEREEALREAQLLSALRARREPLPRVPHRARDRPAEQREREGRPRSIVDKVIRAVLYKRTSGWS